MIEIEAVTRRYGKLTAVDEVSLTIGAQGPAGAGEIYSLVGANGAGKSTLMRMIVGITEPDAGRILICGEDLAHRIPTTKRHLGYLPEELLFYDLLTGNEYLRLVAGLKEAEVSQVADELEFFGIAHAADKLVGGYSLGMRKKLGLCAAMLGSPEILVLDEPLNGLDVEMMRKLRRRLESERGRGRTILVSSHVMSFVERVSDRIGVMRAGKLVAEGSAADLRQRTGLASEDFEDVFFTLAE